MGDKNEKLRKILCNFPELKLAILFGSCAAGRQNRDSDIDIAVASHAVLTLASKMRMIEAIAQSTKRPVDLIDLNLRQEPIFSQAITKGQVILCRDKHLYVAFMQQVVYNAADFIPLRMRILSARRKSWINS